MSCTPLPKAAKPVWAKQLTRLPCLVVCVKFQFVYTTKSKMGSQLLLDSTYSQVQLGRGSQKAFNECLCVSNICNIMPPSPKLWLLADISLGSLKKNKSEFQATLI